MMRYLLILLLINTYGRSLGTPVFNTSSNGKILISNLLSDLRNDCKNEFAAGQIDKILMERSLKECNLTAPPFYETEMQCLVFLDASSLLCNISTASFPNLAADFKASGKLTADEFCAEAAHFRPLPTTFQKLISKVFQKDAACKKVCMDKDVLSGDTNFVCKYYKWSMGFFQTPASTILNSNIVENGLPVSGAETGDGKPSGTVTTNANKASRDPIKDPEMNVTETSSINVQNDQPQSHIESSSNGQTTSGLNQLIINQASKPIHLEDNHKPQKQTGHDDSNADTLLNQENPLISNNGQAGPGITNNGQGRPGIANHAQGGPGIANNGQRGPGIANNGQGGPGIANNAQGGPGIANNAQGDPGIANNAQGGAVLDHPDAGAGDIGDSERDDGNDAEDDGDEESDLDVRNSQAAPNTQFNPIGESSQREFLPNISEGFTEDDDHFFPFFLTAVIIVIILYVLYHNKSKVGKMFFGLIVEGRQSGRRRNSRGHSYRRLDTLEQAMSASASAPPSKIIY